MGCVSSPGWLINGRGAAPEEDRPERARHRMPPTATPSTAPQRDDKRQRSDKLLARTQRRSKLESPNVARGQSPDARVVMRGNKLETSCAARPAIEGAPGSSEVGNASTACVCAHTSREHCDGATASGTRAIHLGSISVCGLCRGSQEVQRAVIGNGPNSEPREVLFRDGRSCHRFARKVSNSGAGV